MAGWMERRRLRGMMSPLLEGELDASLSEQVRARIAADPVLSVELKRLQQAVGLLHAWPQRALPETLHSDLDLTLALEVKPLRARYGELLDGSLGVRGAAELRAAIAADPELDAEFARLQAGMEIWRAEVVPPVPSSLRSRIAGAVLAEESALRDRAATPVLPMHRTRPRWALAGAAALLLFGLTVAKIGMRPGTGGPGLPAVATAQATSGASTLSSPVKLGGTVRVALAPTKPVAPPPPVAVAPTPVVDEETPRPVRYNSSHRSGGRKVMPPSEEPRNPPVLPPPPVKPQPLVVMVAQPSSASSVRGGEMPAPGTLNSVEPASSPMSIDLSSSSTRGGDL